MHTLESKDNIINILNVTEKELLNFFGSINQSELYILVLRVIDIIIEIKDPNIIIDHYLILYKITLEYNSFYANGFFNEFFFNLYLKLPKSVIYLFMELPNFQFFLHFLDYLRNKIKESKNKKRKMIIYLYKKIIFIFSEQLKNDLSVLKKMNICEKCDNCNKFIEIPSISNVSLYIPSDIYKEIHNNDISIKHIAYNVFGKKEKSIERYNIILEKILKSLIIIRKIHKNFVYNNEIDITIPIKYCFRLFKNKLSKEINKN
jgi:hypothetical protein